MSILVVPYLDIAASPVAGERDAPRPRSSLSRARRSRSHVALQVTARSRHSCTLRRTLRSELTGPPVHLAQPPKDNRASQTDHRSAGAAATCAVSSRPNESELEEPPPTTFIVRLLVALSALSQRTEYRLHREHALPAHTLWVWKQLPPQL